MKNAKHTPGPWQKENGTIWAGKESVCFIHDAYGEDFPNMEANAHLIAAAPDLLEALKQCLNSLEKFTQDARNEPVEIAAARAAIAKAQPALTTT